MHQSKYLIFGFLEQVIHRGVPKECACFACQEIPERRHRAGLRERVCDLIYKTEPGPYVGNIRWCREVPDGRQYLLLWSVAILRYFEPCEFYAFFRKLEFVSIKNDASGGA